MPQLAPPEDSVETQPTLSVVVPTFNERRNIELLLAELRQVFDRLPVRAEVIVVDDNSPDGTGEYVEERAAREAWIRVVRRSGKLGLTSAVTAGFAVARGEILGVMDADLSHPASAIPRMLDAMTGDVDFVVGSRYVDGGRVEGWPLSRWIMSRTACLLAWPFTPVRDSMSGFFLIRRSCVEGVELTARGFKIGLDLLVNADYRSVREVPITFVDRRYGESKVSRGEVVNLLRSLGGYAVSGGVGRRLERARREARMEFPGATAAVASGYRTWVAVLLLLLLAWGLTDVRRRAAFNPAKPQAHRTDVTVYTEAGAAFFHPGTDPYRVTNPRGWHYLYPPLFAIAVAPLERLPESEQGFAFYLISLLLVYGCVVESSRLLAIAVPGVPRTRFALFDRSLPRWLIWSAVAAVLFPLLNTLQRGQVAPFTLYPLLLGTRLLLDRRSMAGVLSGGIALALPVAIKLTPLLPVAMVGWVLWVRALLALGEAELGARMRQAAGLTAGVAGGLVIWILLVPAAFVGWDANLGHLHTWVDRVAANDEVDEDNDFFGASRRNQSFANAARLLVETLDRDSAPSRVAGIPGTRFSSEVEASPPNPPVDRALLVARAVIFILLLAAGIRLAASGAALDVAVALGLGAVGSVVLSPLSWGHHYVIIWPGVLFVPAALWISGRKQTAQVLAAAAAALTVLHYLFTGPLGSVGLLGVGTAAWLVVAIATLPRPGEPRSAAPGSA